MKVGILGQPCIDEIVDVHGSVSSRSLGGIFYSYAAMERAMVGSNDRFVPLTWRSSPDREFIEPLLTRLSHCEREGGLWPTDALTNRVQLVYHTASDRTEFCPTILPPLTSNELSPVLGSLDTLFVNMISGFDIARVELERALAASQRSGKRPWVHIDLHALTLGPLSTATPDGGFGNGRTWQGAHEWKEWLQLADSFQLNEQEARWFGDPDIQSEAELVAYLRESQPGPKYVVITRAARGASLVDLVADTRADIAAPAIEASHPTGAGDAFGAVFSYVLTKGGSAVSATRAAVEWASWCASLPTIDSILGEPIPANLSESLQRTRVVGSSRAQTMRS